MLKVNVSCKIASSHIHLAIHRDPPSTQQKFKMEAPAIP